MTTELVFRRVFPLVVVAMLGAAAYLQARGLTELLAVALMGGPPARGASKPPRPQAPTSEPPRPSLPDTPLPSAGSAPPDPLAWPVCTGIEAVIVTESPDPSWSLTSLRLAGEPRARLRRAGDMLSGKQLVFIGFNPRWQTPAVWLEGGADSCQSVLTRQTTPSPVEPVLASTQVARATVERTLRDPLSSLRSVRVVPEQMGGRVVGLRLFNVGPGSLLASVGVQSGDRIETVNGFDIATPSQGLEAYAHLRSARSLKVHLVRRGQPLDLQLNID
jgi:general secretion pathway protein C